jgi:hypothetical protein
MVFICKIKSCGAKKERTKIFCGYYMSFGEAAIYNVATVAERIFGGSKGYD